MGIYLNQGNDKFARAINSEIYIDKTMLIEYTNKRLNTMQQNICVSRPRRFGKSTAVNMLTAYYSRGCDSESLFKKYKIAKSEIFKKNLYQYDMITLNMQEFLSRSKTMDEMVSRIKKLVMRDIKKAYPNVDYFDDTDLTESMKEVYEETKRPFIIIIDEWDCVFREYKDHKDD